MRPKALCLLSGGIDSAVAAHMLKDSLDITAMTVEYGQPVAEKIAAISVCDWLNVPKILCRIQGWNSFAGDATNYFPARNTIFLSHALLECECRSIPYIIIGANVDDQRDYPDCRPEYFRAFETVAATGTRTKIEILTPLIELTKADIVAEAIKRRVPLERTMSCYHPRDRTPCGMCAACNLRRSAYEANGLEFLLERLVVDFGESKPWQHNNLP